MKLRAGRRQLFGATLYQILTICILSRGDQQEKAGWTRYDGSQCAFHDRNSSADRVRAITGETKDQGKPYHTCISMMH